LTQGLVYLLAITLAGIAAYYYTLYLFESLPPGGFIVANLLLYLWLMIFAAMTLLGSSIGKTTASAAGVAAIGGIALLLSAVIPRYGPLVTSGLISWATALLLGQSGTVNFGALATALGLVLLMLVGSIAAIEEQEI
ncbi:MAG TPA: hypothetical protein VFI27_00155, partial [candidate division Zixibacteria bacterium]|nr:hypothetical protein [candidate division Zixibacteria bacterium]